MLKEIVQTTTSLLRLAQDVQENRAEIKEVRTEFRQVLSALERLTVRMDQADEHRERDQQMIILQVENLLLRQRELLALPEPAAAGEP